MPGSSQASEQEEDEKILPIEQAQEIVNGCLQVCNKEYEEKGKLENFNYYDKFEVNALIKIGEASRWLLEQFGVKNKDVKGAFCRQSTRSLDSCYSADSTVLNICKRGARGVLSLFTNDRKKIDIFSSCKDTCKENLEKFCSK